jgi:hypothetical protein
MTRVLCSWCESFNTVGGPPQCQTCGHDAFQPRMCCGCSRCSLARRRAAASDAPAPLVPAITEALNRLRPEVAPGRPAAGTPNPEEDEAMSRTPKKVTAPVTREVKRTPVSAELAAKIRDVDAALEAEFNLDFAFVILARGNLVAASNARDGVVPPTVATDTPEGGS